MWQTIHLRYAGGGPNLVFLVIKVSKNIDNIYNDFHTNIKTKGNKLIMKKNSSKMYVYKSQYTAKNKKNIYVVLCVLQQAK